MRAASRLLIISLLLPGSSALAVVDPDCHEGAEAKRCIGARLGDAESADLAVSGTLTEAGFKWPDYSVRYVRGEELDRLQVSLLPKDGKREPKDPAERFERAARALAAGFERMQAVRRDVRLGHVLRHVEVVELDDSAGNHRVVYTVPCYEGFCPDYRRSDAEEALRTFGPVLEQAGWSSSLVGFRYRERSQGRSHDELEVLLRAPRGAKAPVREGASRAEAEAALDALVDGIAKLPPGATERLLRGVDSLECWGQGHCVSRELPSTSPPLTEAESQQALEKITQAVGELQASIQEAQRRQPEPKPEPPKDLSLDPKELAIESPLPKEVTHQRLRMSVAAMRICHMRFSEREAVPKGELTALFDIRPDGLVERPRIADTSTIVHPEFSECVLVRLRRMRFPPPEAFPAPHDRGGPVKVTYRFLE